MPSNCSSELNCASWLTNSVGLMCTRSQGSVVGIHDLIPDIRLVEVIFGEPFIVVEGSGVEPAFMMRDRDEGVKSTSLRRGVADRTRELEHFFV